ncbi:hypothetical protein PMAYCL1PPCAC_24701, partial [Pristionchus mayeri]
KPVEWPAPEPKIFLPIKLLSFAATLLPAIGIYSCVLYTLTIGSAAISSLSLSGCPDVKSSLPPVSYSISSWEPQRFIWLLVLMAHLPVRLLIAIILPRVWGPGAGRLILLCCYFAEAASLVLVTVFHVNSIAGFGVHAFFFTSWALSSIFGMSMTIHLMRITNLKDRSKMFHRSFIAKICVLILFIFSFTSIGIFYPLSQRYCLGWAYAIFCIFEYALVGLSGVFWSLTMYEYSTAFAGLCVTAVRHE